MTQEYSEPLLLSSNNNSAVNFMDFIFEFLLELLFDGAVEASTSRKIPKYIRYPLIFLIISFCLAVITGLIVLGIFVLKESLLGGIIILVLGISLLPMLIIGFIKRYKNR